MRKLALLLVLLFAVPFFAQTADDSPATAEDIQQMFEATNSRRLFDSMMANMTQELPDMIISSVERQMPGLTPEQRSAVRDYATKSVQDTMKNVPFQQLLDAMAPVYRKHFTHADIQQVVAFYRTPVGRKMIDKMPEVSAESMQASMPLMQKWVEEQMTQVQKNSEELARKLREANKPKPAATPEKKG